MSLTEHFRTLQKYEAWANRATLDSMETVPPAARGGTQFVRAQQVMAHNQLARSVWLARLQGRTEAVADWFPAWPVAQKGQFIPQPAWLEMHRVVRRG